jgi:hypothetical protein
MAQLGLITKVSDSTDWLIPMVLPRKSNGDIQICLDQSDFNIAIKLQHDQILSTQ